MEWGQQDPEPNDQPDIQSLVINDIEARRQHGIEVYGTALQPFNGRNALKDAYEEAIDLSMYLRQMMAERQTIRRFIVTWLYVDPVDTLTKHGRAEGCSFSDGSFAYHRITGYGSGSGIDHPDRWQSEGPLGVMVLNGTGWEYAIEWLDE